MSSNEQRVLWQLHSEPRTHTLRFLGGFIKVVWHLPSHIYSQRALCDVVVFSAFSLSRSPIPNRNLNSDYVACVVQPSSRIIISITTNGQCQWPSSRWCWRHCGCRLGLAAHRSGWWMTLLMCVRPWRKYILHGYKAILLHLLFILFIVLCMYISIKFYLCWGWLKQIVIQRFICEDSRGYYLHPYSGGQQS